MEFHKTLCTSLALVLSFATTAVLADPYSSETSLADFSDLTRYDLSKASLLSTVVDSNGVTRGVFNIDPDGYIGQLSSAKVSLGPNWSNYNQFYVYAVNKGTTEANLRLIIYVSGDPKNSTNSWQGSAKIPADGKTHRYLLWFNSYDPAVAKVGEYPFPPLDRLATNVYNKATGPYTNIVWKIKNSSTTAAKVEIGYFKLVKSDTTLNGIVDRYGQQSNRTWGSLDGKQNDLFGKVTNDAQFITRKNSEISFYQSNPGPGQPFGVDTSQAPTNTTGKWRVIKMPSGKYYLQTPSSKLFWSVGVNGVHDGSMTVTEGRENKFQQLPVFGADCTGTSTGQAPWELSQSSRKSVSFNCLNQIIKYGAGTARYSGWMDMTRKRLDYWGINTVGIDSKKDFMDGSRPYVLKADGSGFSKQIAVNSAYRTWGNPPDVFDSTYASFVSARVNDQVASYGSPDPNAVLGMFFDNEQSFGYAKNDESEFLLALGILRSASTQAAKVAIVNLLQSEKGYSISTLNSRWGENYADYSALLADTSHTGPGTNTNKRADFEWMTSKYLNQYYSTIRQAIRSNTNFKGLYLGSRLMISLTRPQAAAAIQYVDVISVNSYRTLDNIRDQFLMLKDEMTKAGREVPILFSEYGVGKSSDGGVGGPNEVSSAQERIQTMNTFLGWAFSQPIVVGVHLYPLNDMMITGRYTDFENAKMGLVNETDTVNEDVQSALIQITKPADHTTDLFSRREAAPPPVF